MTDAQQEQRLDKARAAKRYHVHAEPKTDKWQVVDALGNGAVGGLTLGQALEICSAANRVMREGHA